MLQDSEAKAYLGSIDPHDLGPLTDEPVQDDGQHRLFPGENRFLSRRMIRRKADLLDAIRMPLGPVLETNERVLYVASAQQLPTIMEWIGLGWWFLHLHRVALVFTERRMIEILLDMRGRKACTRIRSFPLGEDGRAKLSFGKLIVRSGKRRKFTWRVDYRRDRKLLKILIPRIAERSLAEMRSDVTDDHVWHCPTCAAQLQATADSCGGCGTQFRSAKIAAGLSLAIPGGGLYYAGRPIMATLDLIGEFFLYALVALSLATSADAVEAAGGVVAGLFLLFVTKLESVHLSTILVRRTLPVSAETVSQWRKAAWGAGLASLAAIAFAIAASGTLASTLTQDLDFRPPSDDWSVTRSFDEFDFDGDPSQRSQWAHASGLEAAVFAYPLDAGDTWQTFRQDYLDALRQEGAEPSLLEDRLPGDLAGFRCAVPYDMEDGTRFVDINYMIWNVETASIHQVNAFVPADTVDYAMTTLDELVAASAWVPATDPMLQP